jgi:hypothetical protein
MCGPVKIVRQDAEMGVNAAIFAAKGTRTGHSDRIGPFARNTNSLRMRHSTLGRESQKYLHGAGADECSVEGTARCGSFMAYAARFVLEDTASPRKTRIA